MQRSNSYQSKARTLRITLILLLSFSSFWLVLSSRQASRAQIGDEREDSVDTIGFVENFDGVAAPALPAMWSSTASGSLVPFVTTTNSPDTSPNALFVPDPAPVGMSTIVSPVIRLGHLNSHLIFRNSYSLENGFDGGLLEIKIGAGGFMDIVQAGGVFVNGGYTGVISNTFSNPLAGRSVWTGFSNGYVTTELILPQSAHGQFVQFRWIIGTDISVVGAGWWIDGFTVTNIVSGENTLAVAIPDSGIASPYPSSITLTNMIGAVTDVVVSLENFSHTAPDDVDLLLLGPGGQSVILMSDAGGAIPVTNAGLTFQDEAAGNLPDEGPLVSGVFRPTNVGSGDTFPAPAPVTAPTGSSLGVFNGTNPNGTWSMYLVDDNGNNTGSIANGWALSIGTSATSCSVSLNPTIQTFPITGGSGNFNVVTPFGCGWTAATNSPFIDITSATSGAGGSQAITFDVEPNMMGGRSGRITVSTGTLDRHFTVQQPSGCPFALSQESLNFNAGGGAGSVQVTALDVCGWTPTTTSPWITNISGTGSGNGTVNFTVAANSSSAPRTGTIVIGARELAINQTGAPSGARPFDFDGDGSSDVGIFRPSAATWYVLHSSNGNMFALQFGIASDRIAPADYDGDNKVDIAVFRNGAWYWIQSSDSTFKADQWGLSGDIPVPADYDFDNKADVAVYRPGSPGVWYIKRSSDSVVVTQPFGTSNDRPLPGDYDNDGKADLIVYRAGTNSSWFVLRSSDSSVVGIQFGSNEDLPVPGDYDGDGAVNPAVFRPSQGIWYTSTDPATNYGAIAWGQQGDVPIPGDFDGDRRTDTAVFRQGIWYIRLSTTSSLRSVQWGVSSDTPIPSAFILN